MGEKGNNANYQNNSKNLNYSPYSDFYHSDDNGGDIKPEYAYDYRQYKVFSSGSFYDRGDFASRYKLKSGKKDKLQPYERMGFFKRLLNIITILSGLVIIACLIALNLNSLGIMPLTLSDSFISVKLYNFDFSLIILVCSVIISLIWCVCFSGKARIFSLLAFGALAVYVGIIYFMNWFLSDIFLKNFNFGFTIIFIILALGIILSEAHLKFVKIPCIILLGVLTASIICQFIFTESGFIVGAAFNMSLFLEVLNWVLLISLIALCFLLCSFWARKKIKERVRE